MIPKQTVTKISRAYRHLSDRLARLELRIEQKDGERLFDNEVIMAKVSRLEEQFSNFTKSCQFCEESKSDEPKFIVEPDCTCHNDMRTCRRHPEKNKGYKPSDEPKLPKLPKNWGKIKTPDGRIVDFETMKEDEPELTTNNSQVTNKPSECEHEWEDSKVWETHNTCKKCFVMVHKPTPSDESTISISRNIAEDWLAFCIKETIDNGKDDEDNRMIFELRRAIGKGKI